LKNGMDFPMPNKFLLQFLNEAYDKIGSSKIQVR